MSAHPFKVGDVVTLATSYRPDAKIVRAGIHVSRVGKRIALTDGTEWADKRGQWERYGRVSWNDHAAAIREHLASDATRAALENEEEARKAEAERANKYRDDATAATGKANAADAKVAQHDEAIARMKGEIERLDKEGAAS